MEIEKMNREQLLDLLFAYDRYIIEYILQHGPCTDGCCPVCVDEFYDCDFMESEEDQSG